jgi:chromosome segregation ATPase
MVSIAEDQSLPVDLNGTSLQLSSPMDSTVHEPASLSNSDIETPGLLPTLNSVGGISPHRVRTMKDQELQLSELRKENFGLKLRIYHLEEALNTKWGERSEGWQLNIDLQVQMDNLKKELAEKDELILQARSGLKSLAAKHAQELNELRQAVRPAEDTHALEERLEEREAELEDAQQQTEEANARADEMQRASEQLEEELRQKEREMDQMQRELDDMKKDLADQATATSVNTGSCVGGVTSRPLLCA